MFKIICDIHTIFISEGVRTIFPGETLSPAAVRDNTLIGYNNCRPCQAVTFKLTSTSKIPLYEDVKALVELWNNNILSPINPNYYKAYQEILDNLQNGSVTTKKLKFIGLFESDPSLVQHQYVKNIVQIFEAIINTSEYFPPHAIFRDSIYNTGYKGYHAKSSFVKITNTSENTFFAFGSFQKVNDADYYVNKDLISYALRDKGVLKCISIDYQTTSFSHYAIYNGQIYSKDGYEYIKFLEKDFANKINAQLSFVRQCKTGNEVIIIFDGALNQDFDMIKEQCERINSKLQSMQEVLESICNSKIDQEKEIVSNDFFSITCTNYKRHLTFDEAGEIIRTDFFSDAETDIINNLVDQSNFNHYEL